MPSNLLIKIIIALLEFETKSTLFLSFILLYTVTLIFSLESFKSGSLRGDALNGFKLIFALALFNIVGLTGRFTPITVWPFFVLLSSLRVWVRVMFQWSFSNVYTLIRFFTPSNLSLSGRIPITLIEVLSSLIRPLTLGIRLCANISGGHLITELIEELGGALGSSLIIGCYELFVCLIQALIFSLLLFNYFKELE